MVSDREAYIADKVRKLATLLLSAGGTYFLLRVLYRTAEGTQQLLDPELIAFFALALIAVLWIRGTRRVRRTSSGASDATAEPVARESADESAD